MAEGGCARVRAGDFLGRRHSQSLLPKSKNLKREKKGKGTTASPKGKNGDVSFG